MAAYRFQSRVSAAHTEPTISIELDDMWGCARKPEIPGAPSGHQLGGDST
jgi:hypothetical protein